MLVNKVYSSFVNKHIIAKGDTEHYKVYLL